MIIKTTDANDTLPIGLYKYTDDNNEVQYLNNLKGDKLVSSFNGKNLTRLAELFIKYNNTDYQALDGKESWTDFKSLADTIGIEEEKILSTTKYTYDTGCIAYTGSGYDCPVYKKDSSATNIVKITSLESKNLYVYQKQKTETHITTNENNTFSIDSTDVNQYKITVNFTDNATASGTFDFDKSQGDQYLCAGSTTSGVGSSTLIVDTSENALLTTKTETETETINFTVANNKNISSVTVNILYNIYAIVDFTGRNAPSNLYGCPVDKVITENEKVDHWCINSKLNETVETTSIIKLVNKTN